MRKFSTGLSLLCALYTTTTFAAIDPFQESRSKALERLAIQKIQSNNRCYRALDERIGTDNLFVLTSGDSYADTTGDGFANYGGTVTVSRDGTIEIIDLQDLSVGPYERYMDTIWERDCE